ncbi:MAG TPA: type II toxin-antitoxin system HicB family antitoxin [Ardenticatenaceae bacterium]|nr:type II toxin-antitoxin system HicB family antitoxin [Ardenticatenaceae bacterium]
MSETVQLSNGTWSFTVVVEPDNDDGGYIVYCPALKGCWSQGETIDEALHNIVDAVSGWLAVHIERSLDISRLAGTDEPLTEPLTLSVQIP